MSGDCEEVLNEKINLGEETLSYYAATIGNPTALCQWKKCPKAKLYDLDLS